MVTGHVNWEKVKGKHKLTDFNGHKRSKEVNCELVISQDSEVNPKVCSN